MNAQNDSSAVSSGCWFSFLLSLFRRCHLIVKHRWNAVFACSLVRHTKIHVINFFLSSLLWLTIFHHFIEMTTRLTWKELTPFPGENDGRGMCLNTNDTRWPLKTKKTLEFSNWFHIPYCAVRIISKFRIGSLVGKTSNSSITTELTFLFESADSAFTVLITFPWSANRKKENEKRNYNGEKNARWNEENWIEFQFVFRCKWHGDLRSCLIFDIAQSCASHWLRLIGVNVCVCVSVTKSKLVQVTSFNAPICAASIINR